jgi:hypothetical protein
MAFLKKYWWVLAIIIVAYYTWTQGFWGSVSTPSTATT